jgi:hypothetical protein
MTVAARKTCRGIKDGHSVSEIQKLVLSHFVVFDEKDWLKGCLPFGT